MFKLFRRDERGSTAVEYSLIGTLIGVAIVVGVGSTTKATGKIWDDTKGKVVAVMGGSDEMAGGTPVAEEPPLQD